MNPLLCLATAIFFEARDQPISGQYAVAEVVVNLDNLLDNSSDILNNSDKGLLLNINFIHQLLQQVIN